MTKAPPCHDISNLPKTSLVAQSNALRSLHEPAFIAEKSVDLELRKIEFMRLVKKRHKTRYRYHKIHRSHSSKLPVPPHFYPGSIYYDFSRSPLNKLRRRLLRQSYQNLFTVSSI